MDSTLFGSRRRGHDVMCVWICPPQGVGSLSVLRRWRGRGGVDGGSADPARTGIRVGLIGPDSPTRDFHRSPSPPNLHARTKEWPSKGDLRR